MTPNRAIATAAADQAEPLCTDQVLLDDWHVVGFSSDLESGMVLPAQLLGHDLVLWRDASGAPHVWEDLCIHRDRDSRRAALSTTRLSARITAGGLTAR